MPKKKILYFVPQFPVLSETFIEREISKLVDFDNLDVTVVALAPGTGALSKNLEDKVHYEHLTIGICLSAVFSYVFSNPKRILSIHELVKGEDKVPYLINFTKDSDARAKSSVLGRFYRSRFIHFLKGIAYAKVFEKYQPDHLHINFLSDSSTVGMIAAKILDIPFSISAHAIDVFVDGTLIPIKAREAKFISVCNGNTWKEVVRQANLTKSSGKVKLMFHGINTEALFSDPPWDRPSKPVILSIGRLVEKKGHEYLIRASKLLKEQNIDHLIRIGGGGPMYKELTDLINDLNVSDTVEIIGQSEKEGPTNKQVGSLMKSADIYSAHFIVASSGDRDGLPTTVIEAALAKLPIIATDAGSMADLINKDTGVVIPQKDPVALANSIKHLIEDSSLRDKLVSKVYSEAIKNFDINQNILELEKMFLS